MLLEYPLNIFWNLNFSRYVQTVQLSHHKPQAAFHLALRVTELPDKSASIKNNLWFDNFSPTTEIRNYSRQLNNYQFLVSAFETNREQVGAIPKAQK